MCVDMRAKNGDKGYIFDISADKVLKNLDWLKTCSNGFQRIHVLVQSSDILIFGCQTALINYTVKKKPQKNILNDKQYKNMARSCKSAHFLNEE